MGQSRAMKGGMVTLSPGQRVRQKERSPGQAPRTGWGRLAQGSLTALKCGDRVKWAPPALGGRQGTPRTPASMYVSMCLALLFGSLALSATLCVSLCLAMCLSNYVSAYATLQVIHPLQPHTQGEGRAGPGQDVLSRAG